MLKSLGNLIELYFKDPRRLLKHISGAFQSVVRFGPVGAFKKLLTVFAFADRMSAERMKEVEFRERTAQVLKTLSQSRSEKASRVPLMLSAFYSRAETLGQELSASMRADLVSTEVIKQFGLFDEEFYRNRYLPGQPEAKALQHYISLGVERGFWPNANFDPVEYLLRYPDVAETGLVPVLHFTFFGAELGYKLENKFDPEFYRRMNEDLDESGLPPFSHFMKIGRFEGRKAHPGYGSVELNQLASSLARGTILLVSHDSEIGGAQTIALNLAKWLRSSTLFNVQILLMKGGVNTKAFSDVAPVFDYAGYELMHGREEARQRLNEWIAPDLQCIFLNSVASGGFFDIVKPKKPVVSYVHELPKIIAEYGDFAYKIMSRSTHVLSGSQAVQRSLQSNYSVQPKRMSVIYDHVDRFDPQTLLTDEERIERKSELGLDPSAQIIMGCGNVHWRKSPNVFIDVAIKALEKSDKSLQFVWIGDGEDFEACVQRVDQLGLTEKVLFVGHQSDIQSYFSVCDVFLLPSEEDPFPLVTLFAALAEAPTVCFQDAGGIPEFVADQHGTSVPFMDSDAMANALLAYVDDAGLRGRHGKRARERTLREFTLQTIGPQILEILRSEAGLKPVLSVVVPNYNYDKYLGVRLSSIQNQTFQDFEVILLDDVSGDQSLPLLEEFAALRPGSQLVVNQENSGSPFKQWLRGIDLARGQFIWIAEADDDASPTLLETLLPVFEDRNVSLSFCKSVPIDEDGSILGDYEELYLNRIAQDRWSKPFICSDATEINEGLGIANCIPNASSVVFRKFAVEETFREQLQGMKLCGDWLFYVRAIENGYLSYSSQPLNFHRRHGETVTKGLEGSQRYFDELTSVRSYIGKRYTLDLAAQKKIQAFVEQDLSRFHIADDKKDSISAAVNNAVQQQKALPTIAVIAPDLAPGGGQVFAITLANAWVKKGGRAVLFNVGQLPDHPAVKCRIADDVCFFDCRNLPKPFEDIIREMDVDIIHSSIWWADKFVLEHRNVLPEKTAWTTTMHGCAESILDNPDIDPTFDDKFKLMLENVDAWTYTADKNLKVFERFGKPGNLRRLDNGIEVSAAEPLDRKALGIRDDSLVLCVATRAIFEKGWLAAVKIVERLNADGIKADLLLIGEGPAADQIRRAPPKNVHLIGQVHNLQDYISMCDIGLLPTYFVGESLPLVLLEFMGMGKPVIASDLGEIANMLGRDPSDSAGMIVPLSKGLPDVDQFVQASMALSDESVRKAYSDRAVERFNKHFELQIMLSNYERVYQEAMAMRSATSPRDTLLAD